MRQFCILLLLTLMVPFCGCELIDAADEIYLSVNDKSVMTFMNESSYDLQVGVSEHSEEQPTSFVTVKKHSSTTFNDVNIDHFYIWYRRPNTSLNCERFKSSTRRFSIYYKKDEEGHYHLVKKEQSDDDL